MESLQELKVGLVKQAQALQDSESENCKLSTVKFDHSKFLSEMNENNLVVETQESETEIWRFQDSFQHYAEGMREELLQYAEGTYAGRDDLQLFGTYFLPNNMESFQDIDGARIDGLLDDATKFRNAALNGKFLKKQALFKRKVF